MVIHSLLYVSKSALPAASAAASVREIVEAATVANHRLNLTGALIFTSNHFVQILEGNRTEVDNLMAVIERDARHTELRIVERKTIARRRFSDWSLAYMGPSTFVSRHVMLLLDQTSAQRDWRGSAWISELMVELSNAA